LSSGWLCSSNITEAQSIGNEIRAEGEEMTDQEDRFAGLELDKAIRLRWALRDIKAKRTKSLPVSPEDLQTLIGMGLAEMRDEIPAVTNEGDRALGWS
jgi:hypothetical protein